MSATPTAPSKFPPGDRELAKPFLRRHGHRVWGLARTETKAARLARHEIEPVSGDLADPKSYADVAARCSVLIHTAFDYSGDGVAKNKLAIETLLDAGRRGGEPKTLIFTSGAWVYGNTGDHMVDETTPLNPIKLVAWRPAHEQLVLRATGVRGLVIRPGCVYGGAGGLTAQCFAAATPPVRSPSPLVERGSGGEARAGDRRRPGGGLQG